MGANTYQSKQRYKTANRSASEEVPTEVSKPGDLDGQWDVERVGESVVE